MSKGLSNEEKYYLCRFLKERYGFSMEQAAARLNQDFSRDDDWTQLDFTKSRRFSINTNEDKYELSQEFVSYSKLLDTLIKTHLQSYPGSKKTYTSQLSVPEEKKFELKENPNLAFSYYMPTESIEQLKEQITEYVNTLLTLLEDEEIPSEYKKLYRVIFAIYLYTVNEKDGFTDTQNIHNVFRKLPNRFYELITAETETAYRNLGRKIEVIFENPEKSADELVKYYSSNVSELVRTIEKSLQAVD